VAAGNISALQIVNGGSNYSNLGSGFYYANYPISYAGFYSDYELIARPGVTQTVNAYYGTGVHSRGLQ
jgi:hypothetical protein